MCIPTYNYGRYLAAAVSSVLQQTFDDWELVIVDNGSTDETRVVAAGFDDARVQYRRYAVTVPMIQNFNRCLEHASGEFILFLCADDLLTPPMLGLLVRALDDHPVAGLAVAGQQQDIDDDGRPLGAPRRHPLGPGLVSGGDVLIAQCRRALTVGLPPQVLLRRAAVLEVGGMDPLANQAADNDLFSRVLERWDAVYVPEALFHCRWHDDMQTQRNRRSLEGIRSDAYVFERLFRESAILRGNARLRRAYVRHRLFPWFRRAVAEAARGRFGRSAWILSRIAIFDPVPWWFPYFMYLYGRNGMGAAMRLLRGSGRMISRGEPAATR